MGENDPVLSDVSEVMDVILIKLRADLEAMAIPLLAAESLLVPTVFLPSVSSSLLFVCLSDPRNGGMGGEMNS
eukprot:CAMPEP_0185776210 /NCGR_PEP_ID=MMETSP1174-20130828/84903_1 /TAXON_ID=35687 /ORGANISM="Dictyocha speculum, Strain CCMP1381" /LENGTH=72 /DNA_ID=CAMNT_0028464069 /DNA_START=180 /DNA_END=398 /DNA_ORIENTATION=+